MSTGQTARFGIGVVPIYSIDGAASFIDRTGLQGRCLNDILFGGPLLGHFGPDRKVFVDGRLEVYGDHFLAEYKKAMDDPEHQWNAYLQTYRFDYVILGVLSPYSAHLLTRLAQDPAWACVYLDASAVIFVRKEGINRDLLRSLPFADLPVLTAQAALPASAWNRFWHPPYPLRELAMGRLALLFKEQEAAVAWNQQALILWPESTEALFNLGTLSFNRGHFDDAERYYASVLRLASHNAAAMAALGEVYLSQQKWPQAIPILNRAVRLQPGLTSAWVELGTAQLMQKNSNAARTAYEQAIQLGVVDAMVRNNLGVAYYRLGQREEAIRQLKLALDIDPHYTSAQQTLRYLVSIQNGNPS